MDIYDEIEEDQKNEKIKKLKTNIKKLKDFDVLNFFEDLDGFIGTLYSKESLKKQTWQDLEKLENILKKLL